MNPPERTRAGMGALMISTGFASLAMEVRYFFNFKEMIWAPLVLKVAVYRGVSMMMSFPATFKVCGAVAGAALMGFAS